MKLDYKKLRELVQLSLEGCGGMVHPTSPPPITIIPNKKPDHEGKMAKRQVFGIVNDASQIDAMLMDDQQLDGWIQSKLTKAADYLSAVKKYLEYDLARSPMPALEENTLEERGEFGDVPLEDMLDLEKQVISFRDALGGGGMTKSYSNNFLEFLQGRIEQKTLRDAGLREEARSKNQQQLMGAALRCKRTGDCSSEQVKKLAGSMSEKELEDFASTSHKGLPDKVQENTLADNAKDQASDKRGDVRDVAKFMFKEPRLGPALAKLKDDKREAAQLISIIGGQLGLTPDDLVQIAKMAAREK
tara:strand:- start:292 stop:1197 length:906 start_codon:yes stop_codon:yes gene_type:complete